MRRLFFLAALALACGQPRADVEIDWTFGGQACDAAGVSLIQIDVGGIALSPDSFQCSDAPVGVDLGLFLDGPYAVTITGYDSTGEVTYLGEQLISVEGQSRNVFTIDSTAQTGTVTLLWTFGGASCDAAGIKIVSVELDGQPLTDESGSSALSCSSNGTGGITVGPLLAGSHSFSFFADGATQSFQLDQDIAVTVGEDANVPVNLPGSSAEPASALVSWTFNSTHDCSDAGVDNIVVLMDPNADGSGGTAVGQTTCASGRGTAVSMTIFNVPDGRHSFGVRGTSNNLLTYYTHVPVSTVFAAPNQTNVAVDAEPTP
jgi:hypothetical protein